MLSAGLSFISIFSRIPKIKPELKILENNVGSSISLFFIKRLGALRKNSFITEQKFNKFLKMGLKTEVIKNSIFSINIKDKELKSIVEKEFKALKTE